MSQLSSEQINRYKRHLLFPEVGVEGQKKLIAAKVLCIGAGGLGVRSAFTLPRRVSGRLGWRMWMSSVPSNLQRQILLGRSSSASPKSKRPRNG